MIDKEPCFACDSGTVSSCLACNGTGEVSLTLENPAYTASCACGFSLAFTLGGYPREEFLILQKKECPSCKEPITAELVGWGE